VIWLDLEHLQNEAEELGRSPVAAVRSPYVLELDGPVYEGFGSEGEALLFEVGVVVDFHSHYFVYQELRVCSVHLLGSWVSSICHCNLLY